MLDLIRSKGISPFSVCAVLAIVVLAGCDRPTRWRSYEEVNLKRNQPTGSHIHDKAPITTPSTERIRWNTPDGWTEEKGTGMRMAAFTFAGADDKTTCTIIRLSGSAGGLEANVQRWLGQLNLPAMEPDALADFLASQQTITSDGGLPVLVIDLTTLSPSGENDSSILAGMVKSGPATLFIKLSGTQKLIRAERAKFLSLCQSLTNQPER